MPEPPPVIKMVLSVSFMIIAPLVMNVSTRKAFPKHREAAFGLLPTRLVLNHVPMLRENSILDSENVRGDPVDGLTNAGESAVHDDKISVGHNDARLILQRWRKTFDEVKQTLAPRLDVSAVLDVARRPISLCFGVVPTVEERIESLEDQALVSQSIGVSHLFSFEIRNLRQRTLDQRPNAKSLRSQ